MRLLLAMMMAALAVSPGVALAQALPRTAPAPAPSAPIVVQTPVYDFEVVNTYQHDPGAFTQGLSYRDGKLYESTGRRPSTVRITDLTTGAVEQRVDLDATYFGEGLTLVGDRVLTLTWRNETGFIWSADDLSPLGRFDYEGEGWGLTYDGERLILSDGSEWLRFLDPVTFEQTRQVQVTLNGRPIARINELEWVDGEVFANVWMTDIILRIDPGSGQVVGVIDLQPLLPDRTGMDPADDVLNGIAWDAEGRRLFVTGKRWPSVFEIRITEPGG